MTSLFCKTCRLGCSDYNGCSHLNSSTAASVRPLSQVLKGRYNYWPELPRKGKLALEPPSRFCHRHFCHSPATFPMPFSSLSLANFETLLFMCYHPNCRRQQLTVSHCTFHLNSIPAWKDSTEIPLFSPSQVHWIEQACPPRLLVLQFSFSVIGFLKPRTQPWKPHFCLMYHFTAANNCNMVTRCFLVSPKSSCAILVQLCF